METPPGSRRPPGRPTVRRAELPGGTGCPASECRRPKGGRKPTASWLAPPPAAGDNWPDTSRVAGPARALTWAGEPLNADADQASRTEGQVGHRDGERTGGRAGLGRHRLAYPRGQRTAAAAEDLQGDAGAGLGAGPVAAEDDAAVLVEHAGQRAAGDAAQCWAQDRRGRRAGCAVIDGQGRDGSLGPPDNLLLAARAGPARVCTKGQRKTPPARHSRARGPLPPGTGPPGAGAGVGGPVRAPIVWVPAGPWLRRRDRRAVHHAERQEQAGVDRGRRLVGGVECMVTLLLCSLWLVRTARLGGLVVRYAGLSCARCGRGRRGAARP